MFVLLVVGGFLMITLGFIGVYVGYIFQEVKRRRYTWCAAFLRQTPPPITFRR